MFWFSDSVRLKWRVDLGAKGDRGAFGPPLLTNAWFANSNGGKFSLPMSMVKVAAASYL